MHGTQRPTIMRLAAGDALVRQGETGSDVYLVLDGVIAIERDGEHLGECGPGALLGERSHLEGGIRTATLTAVTPCRIASVPAAQFDVASLTELATGHRREEAAQD
jgi:CRP-like cAMP-binding protein